jgi:hypothetical protein
MREGSGLIDWLIGSFIAWAIWIAVRDVVIDSVGNGGWLFFTVLLALADLFLLIGIVREIAR